MESASVAATPAGRPLLQQQGAASRLADPVLKNVLAGLAVGILVLIAYFFGRLLVESRPAFEQTSVLDFVFSNDWVPSQQAYGALPLVVGTLITSGIALIIGVPVAVASAIYVTELAPPRLRQPLTILVELLAAVPSVVYGLWGIFFLAPKLQGFETFVSEKLSFVPFVGGGDVSIPNYFIAGLILAIMILPIVAAISREVMTTVPKDHKEAALALGATRWEMIRMAVIPYSRGGITGAAMLGLGRAIGETIAVTIVIGNAATIGDGLFTQGYSLAAVIANEFGEAASDPVHRASLIAAGLVLFVLTLVVNLLARYLVNRSDKRLRGESGRAVAPPEGAVGAAGGAA